MVATRWKNIPPRCSYIIVEMYILCIFIVGYKFIFIDSRSLPIPPRLDLGCYCPVGWLWCCSFVRSCWMRWCDASVNIPFRVESSFVVLWSHRTDGEEIESHLARIQRLRVDCRNGPGTRTMTTRLMVGSLIWKSALFLRFFAGFSSPGSVVLRQQPILALNWRCRLVHIHVSFFVSDIREACNNRVWIVKRLIVN